MMMMMNYASNTALDAGREPPDHTSTATLTVSRHTLCFPRLQQRATRVVQPSVILS